MIYNNSQFFQLSTFNCRVDLHENFKKKEINFSNEFKIKKFNHLYLQCIDNQIYITNFMDRSK